MTTTETPEAAAQAADPCAELVTAMRRLVAHDDAIRDSSGRPWSRNYAVEEVRYRLEVFDRAAVKGAENGE